jgi:hypothetical protein
MKHIVTLPASVWLRHRHSNHTQLYRITSVDTQAGWITLSDAHSGFIVDEITLKRDWEWCNPLVEADTWYTFD